MLIVLTNKIIVNLVTFVTSKIRINMRDNVQCDFSAI